jgi:putative Ca2+/H+ antiporter (TMEM165/GDT1 family)
MESLIVSTGVVALAEIGDKTDEYQVSTARDDDG